MKIYHVVVTILVAVLAGAIVWGAKPEIDYKLLAEELTKNYNESIQEITTQSFESEIGKRYCQDMINYLNQNRETVQSKPLETVE